jgi:WD40 repeat protein
MTDVMAPREDALQGAPACPYKGLDSYAEADRDYFFARDSFRDLVVANLMASRLTVLYGPSGVGKSSLLQAGVMPLLRQAGEGAFSFLAVEDTIVVYCNSWRDDPLVELGDALRRAVPTPEAVSDLLAGRPALSLELLQEIASNVDADIYLLLDQFEELALYHSGASRDAFDSELARIIKAPRLPVSVLLGVRDDALAKLDRLEPYVPRILDNKLRLDHLTPSEAREAIEQPLDRYNATLPPDAQVDIEPALVVELLSQLKGGSVSLTDGGEAVVDSSESVEAPYLQLVMTRLWAAEAEEGSRVMRIETLRRLGEAEQIVRTHLDTVMAALTEEQREIAARVFHHLVTKSGTKSSHTAEDLADYVEGADAVQVRELLEQLSSARVLRPVPPSVGSNEPRYEIFHDVMAPAVLAWRRRYVAKQERIASEASLVREKEEEEDRHRATRQRLRLVERVLLVTFALLLVVTVSTLAWVIRNNEGMRQAGMLAQYREALRTDPAASLKFALDAWNERQTLEAEEAVRTAVDANTEQVKVQADEGPLSSSELSPDGRLLLTAGKDGIAKLFDAASGRRLLSFEPAQSVRRPELKGASFSPDGSLVLTVTRAGEIHLYNAATGMDLGLLADRGSYAQAAWGKVGGRPAVLTFDLKKPPELWDAQRHSVVATYGTDSSRGAALSSDGRYVVRLEYLKASRSHRLSVWDAESGRLLQRSQAVGTDASVAGFAGTDTGQIVFSAIQKDALRWRLMSWDWREGPSALRTLSSGSEKPDMVVVSKDRRLVAAPLDNRVHVFEAETGKLVGETADGPDWVNAAISFSPDGRLIATNSDDGRALLWLSEQISKSPVAELLGHRGAVTDVRFDPASEWRLTTAGDDGTGRVWQLPERTVLPGSGGSILDAELSRDDQYLVTAEDNGDLRVYNTSANAGPADQWSELSRASLNRYGRLIGASFSPDGLKVLAAGELSRAPSVFDWQSSGRLDALNPWVRQVRTQPVVSADGHLVAAGDVQGDVIVWDLESHEIIAKLPSGGEGLLVAMLVAVPGSDLFAAASTDGTVSLWDPDRQGAPQKTLGIPGGSPMTAIAVSTDGANLVSVSENNEVQVWRLSDGERIQAFPAAPSTNSIGFSRDGRLVTTSAPDGTIHVWNWADGHKLAVLRRHSDSVNKVQFMANGSLLTASDDATVAVFACTTCDPFDKVLKIAQDR